MTTLSEKPPQAAALPQKAAASQAAAAADADTGRLRVVLLLEINHGQEQVFLDAYEQLRHDVAAVPGHVSDQLCQSLDDPAQWLLTSEWESAAPFVAWVDSPSHVEMVKPLQGCVRDTRSMRYQIMRETFNNGRTGRTAPEDTPRNAPPAGDGVVRHALTFTVKPGSEQAAAKVLAEYESPKTEVDATTRLHRTSVFMHGNRVVRAIEVIGDLTTALLHVASQPEVRAVEEAINPYLETARDLGLPENARKGFSRTALPVIHHQTSGSAHPTDLRRHALIYPVRPGCGEVVAKLLERQDQLAADDPANPIVSSVVFQREDVVVRLLDARVPLEQQPAISAGVNEPRAAAVLGRLVDLGPDGDLTSAAGIRRFLSECSMTPVTDRRAQDA